MTYFFKSNVNSAQVQDELRLAGKVKVNKKRLKKSYVGEKRIKEGIGR